MQSCPCSSPAHAGVLTSRAALEFRALYTRPLLLVVLLAQASTHELPRRDGVQGASKGTYGDARGRSLASKSTQRSAARSNSASVLSVREHSWKAWAFWDREVDLLGGISALVMHVLKKLRRRWLLLLGYLCMQGG